MFQTLRLGCFSEKWGKFEKDLYSLSQLFIALFSPAAFLHPSLILLVLEAGIDIDVSTLRLIGTRGFLIAIVGSVLPIAIGIAIALALNGSGDVKSAIAAGACFAPTSLGIALNILRAGGILNTPVGQLIISAAVIDDMIALIILSQLESLSGTIDAAGILIPVVSAFCFLVFGGYVALFMVPPVLKAYVLPRFEESEHGRVEMIIMFAFLLGMMPTTYYAKASYLMGAFVAGLAFCTSHELHLTFVRQFKRVLQWLMRIFFAASIGFQVPIKDFADGVVIYQGLIFALALLGKLAVSRQIIGSCSGCYDSDGLMMFSFFIILGWLLGAQLYPKSLFHGTSS